MPSLKILRITRHAQDYNLEECYLCFCGLCFHSKANRNNTNEHEHGKPKISGENLEFSFFPVSDVTYFCLSI